MSSEAPPYLPVNHVFVDFENVKKVDVALLGRKNFIVHLFLGPQNKKLDVEVVEKLLEHSQAVKLIRSPKVGNNALDFVLAYHLGQAVQSEPKAYFHIVSGDEGFDSLVEFLKSRNLKVKRHSSWEGLTVEPAAKTSSVPAVPSVVSSSPAVSSATKAAAKKKPAAAKKAASPKPPTPTPTLSADAEKLVGKLSKVTGPLPKNLKKLISDANNKLGKSADDPRGKTVVEELRKAGKVKIDAKGAVSYSL